jgi:hypothetical protein
MARFTFNKGVGKGWEIKGFVERYAWYLGGTLLGAFFLFVILYLVGVNVYLALGIMVAIGSFGFVRITALNTKYGAYGAMKESARAKQPRYIVNRNPRTFRNLKQS